MKLSLSNKKAIKNAFKLSLPIIFGYLPTGFIFGFMIVSNGFDFIIAPIMSTVIYAGAGQYLAVKLFVNNETLFNIAMLTFLINSKHLFYGLSLINEFKALGILKYYCIFALTDETYAVLTTPQADIDIKDPTFIFFVSLFDQLGWIAGTLLGALLGNFVKINTDGMDFAMIALFIIILIEQYKRNKSKLPFIIGALSTLIVGMFIKSQMLLIGTILSVIFLIILKPKINNNK